jgi:hypothetical protein
MTLTDIAIKHAYRGKKLAEKSNYILHPFENQNGEHSGKFEILRDIKVGGHLVKRSAHVTRTELIEMYARGLMERETGIRIRVRPSSDIYPTSPPGKIMPRGQIQAGTTFEREVRAFDVSQALTSGLLEQLRILGLLL